MILLHQEIPIFLQHTFTTIFKSFRGPPSCGLQTLGGPGTPTLRITDLDKQPDHQTDSMTVLLFM